MQRLMGPRFRYTGAALVSGLLAALAWPAVGGLVPLIFFAWVPMLIAEERFAGSPPGERPKAFMPYVFLMLAVWNACTTWWLFEVQEPIGTRLFSVIGPNVGNVLVMALPWWLMRWVRARLGGLAAHLALVLFWVAFERAHMAWDLSWPWLTFGNVFAEQVQWVQWYEWTGHLGGSVWVLLMNVLVARALMRPASERVSRLRWSALVLALPLTLSLVRYATFKAEGDPVEVVVVQPNVDPYKEKFGGVHPLQQLDRMLDQAAAVMTPATALVVFPETALQEPFTLEFDGDRPVFHGLWENDLPGSRSYKRIRDFLATRPSTALLAGMSSGQLFPPGADLPTSARPLGATGRGFDAYNAALFVRPDGSYEVYHKSKLVPGVELMPFEEVLGPLGGLAMDLGGTTGSLGVQEEREVLVAQRPALRLAPVICYESIYGDHVAAHVRNGASLLVIMTNDGWWSDSPGYKHHLAYGRLRAVENRRAVARSANTGISGFIDQRGDLHQATEWWEPAAVRGVVLARTDLTLFSRTGDLVGRTAQVLSLLLLVAAAVGRRGRKA